MPKPGPPKNGGSDPAPAAEPAFRQLCHMLSLSKTGKVQSAVDNLVLTTFNIDPRIGEDREPNEVATAVSTYFGVTLDLGDVRLAIETHLKAGRLHIDRTREPSCIVLSPETRAAVATRIDESTQLENAVREEWLSLTHALDPELEQEKLWTALQEYLGQVFSQHGAEAVQLLDSRSDRGRDSGNLINLMDEAISAAGLSGERERSRDALRVFFRDPSPSRLRYMSELLDGTFTFFALTVSDSTAEYLKGQVPSLRLFLDTNVVLAVLGMQDNPLQEADIELLDTIEAERYPFKLYYHERTFKEIIEIVEATKRSLRKRNYTPALSRAYLQYSASRGGGFGLEKAFHSMNSEQEVDAEAFLARFDHLEDLLKERGVKRYNQAGSDLDTDDKGAHIAEFEHFMTQRARPGRPPRRYEALDHDVTVWMYLQRQRTQTTNALRAGALLLSNDYSLHAFDRSYLMKAPHGKGVATVVLPHHLLQVLRPFNRVTKDFDKRFMEIFAAPEFRTTQTNYGPTVSKVLAYLSSFAGVPTETAVLILNDDLLMGRLKDVEASDVEFGKLIESAVIEENSSLTKELGEVSEHLTAANANAATEREARERAEEVVRRAEEAAAKAVKDALTELEATRKQQESEAEARRKAAERAEAEAAEASLLRGELDAARAAGARARSQAIALRRGLAAILVAALVVFIWQGPSWLDWQKFQRHDHRMAIQSLVTIAALGGAYAGAGGRHRTAAVTTVIIAALITAISLI